MAGGAGEGALGVAEQRRLDQRGRDRGAVEREVGLGCAHRRAVQARATSSLPLPDSPSISTGKGVAAYSVIWLRIACIGGALSDDAEQSHSHAPCFAVRCAV